MLERLPYDLIKDHTELVGDRSTTAVCLGDQKPSFSSGYKTITEQFRSLGYHKAITIDYDGNGDITHNLNYPLPDQYYGMADVVYDGGTSEHVANIGESLTTMVRLPRIGGLICQIVPMNCYGGSYYGLDPLLLHDFYRANGFEELELWIACNDSWRFRCIRLASRLLPASFVERTRVRLGKSNGAKTFVLKEGRARKIKPAPDYAYLKEFNNVPIFRNVPVTSMALYVGRKIKSYPEIAWTAQRDYAQ